MSPVQAAMVVARREFSERIRTRAFQISIATTLVIIGAVAVLAGVLGDDGPKTYEVGAQGPEAVAIAAAAKASGPGFDADVEVRRFNSPAQARAAVSDESVDAAVAGGVILTRDDPPDELEQLLQGAARQVRAGEALRSEGVSGSEARRVLDPPPLRTRALEGGADDGDEGVAFAASLLLYLQLIVYGLAVASGVVEEKSSRVVEVLLASIPPRSLLAGKIAGIGLLGLLQLLLTAVVGLGLASASGAIDLDAADAGVLAVVLVWFLLGYLLWACLLRDGRGDRLASRGSAVLDHRAHPRVGGLVPCGLSGARRSGVDDRRGRLARPALVSDHHAGACDCRRGQHGRDRRLAGIAGGGHRAAGAAGRTHLRECGAAYGQAAEASGGLERLHPVAMSMGRRPDGRSWLQTDHRRPTLVAGRSSSRSSSMGRGGVDRALKV